MKDKNIDTQSGSRAQEFEILKRQSRVRLEKQTISGVDANIVIFIVIILGVNGALLKDELISYNIGITVDIKQMISGVIVKKLNVSLHLLDIYFQIISLFVGLGVIRVKDLFCFLIQVTSSIKHTTYHEGVCHSLFVKRSGPCLIQNWWVTSPDFTDNHISEVACGRIYNIDIRFICGKIHISIAVFCAEVCERKLAVVTCITR